ncbi:MAG: hypothetical protein CBC24_01670 [Candidatus Pelagibacter sp. TMED64]|nr:MAG: hypothetical protein CBC24_01670 [Candidatus Pelagibacter sp. TMED64]
MCAPPVKLPPVAPPPDPPAPTVAVYTEPTAISLLVVPVSMPPAPPPPPKREPPPPPPATTKYSHAYVTSTLTALTVPVTVKLPPIVAFPATANVLSKVVAPVTSSVPAMSMLSAN